MAKQFGNELILNTSLLGRKQADDFLAKHLEPIKTAYEIIEKQYPFLAYIMHQFELPAYDPRNRTITEKQPLTLKCRNTPNFLILLQQAQQDINSLTATQK